MALGFGILLPCLVGWLFLRPWLPQGPRWTVMRALLAVGLGLALTSVGYLVCLEVTGRAQLAPWPSDLALLLAGAAVAWKRRPPPGADAEAAPREPRWLVALLAVLFGGLAAYTAYAFWQVVAGAAYLLLGVLLAQVA